MKKREIEKQIELQINEYTPHKARQITGYVKEAEKTSKSKFSKKFAYSIICFVLLLSVSLVTISQIIPKKDKGLVLASEGVIVLDINPSIELTYDKNGIITDVKGLNADGKLIVANNNYTNKSYKTVIEELVSDCKDLGYFSVNKENNAVLITALDRLGNSYKKFNDELNKKFKNEFKKMGLKGIVVHDDDLQGEALGGLTVQKTSLVEQVIALSNQEKTFDDLKDLSISELYILKEHYSLSSLRAKLSHQLLYFDNLLEQEKEEISLLANCEIGKIDELRDILADLQDYLEDEIIDFEDDDLDEDFLNFINDDIFKKIINAPEFAFMRESYVDKIDFNLFYKNLCDYFMMWKTEKFPEEVIGNRKNNSDNIVPPYQGGSSNGFNGNGPKPPNHGEPNHSCSDSLNCEENLPPKEDDFKGNWFGQTENWKKDWDDIKDFFM